MKTIKLLITSISIISLMSCGQSKSDRLLQIKQLERKNEALEDSIELTSKRHSLMLYQMNQINLHRIKQANLPIRIGLARILLESIELKTRYGNTKGLWCADSDGYLNSKILMDSLDKLDIIDRYNDSVTLAQLNYKIYQNDSLISILSAE